MRIGITMPFRDRFGHLLDADAIAERARMIEAAGFDGIWHGDHLPDPGRAGSDRPDPLLGLTVAGLATSRVELGTCVFIAPLRNKYDFAQRCFTAETYVPGRFTIGVGAGSNAHEYEMAGLNFEDRFRLLRESMEAVRAVFEGRPLVDDGAERRPTWAQEVGTPRFVLGAWHSEAQLKRAANEYDGWMASAWGSTSYSASGAIKTGGGLSSWSSMADTINRFRDLGGKRAMICSVNIDLRAPTTPVPDDSPFFLQCDPKEAAERLHFLEELGFDDVIVVPRPIGPVGELVPGGSGERFGPFQHDVTTDELEEIRSLLPKDPRPYSQT